MPRAKKLTPKANPGEYSSGKSRTNPKLTADDWEIHETLVKSVVSQWCITVNKVLGWKNKKTLGAQMGNPDFVPNILNANYEIDENGLPTKTRGTVNVGYVRLIRLNNAIQAVAKKSDKTVPCLMTALYYAFCGKE